MTTIQLGNLEHPAYHQSIRLRGYTRYTTAMAALCAADGGKVLKRVNPIWSKEEHLTLAQQHQAAAVARRAQYSALLDEAAQETFGRPFQITDYQVSAIGREEFSEAKKEALRIAAHSATAHRALADAHRRAAGLRH